MGDNSGFLWFHFMQLIQRCCKVALKTVICLKSHIYTIIISKKPCCRSPASSFSSFSSFVLFLFTPLHNQTVLCPAPCGLSMMWTACCWKDPAGSARSEPPGRAAAEQGGRQSTRLTPALGAPLWAAALSNPWGTQEKQKRRSRSLHPNRACRSSWEEDGAGGGNGCFFFFVVVVLQTLWGLKWVCLNISVTKWEMWSSSERRGSSSRVGCFPKPRGEQAEITHAVVQTNTPSDSSEPRHAHLASF